MTICYFDAFSGISGAMTVGAMADAFSCHRRFAGRKTDLLVPSRKRTALRNRRSFG
jgi:hypothetical protein